MVFQLKRVIKNRHMNQSFTVYRSSGDWVDFEWVENTPEVLTITGIISIASEKEMENLDFADRVKGAIVIHSIEKLNITRDDGTEKGTSDKVVWRGEEYKVKSSSPYADYGYYKSIAVRIKGN